VSRFGSYAEEQRILGLANGLDVEVLEKKSRMSLGFLFDQLRNQYCVPFTHMETPGGKAANDGLESNTHSYFWSCLVPLSTKHKRRHTVNRGLSKSELRKDLEWS
jgi:hypothetical protein